MDIRKALLRDGDVLGMKVDMAVSFGGVASCAGAAPMENIPREVGPNIPGGNKAGVSLATRMSQVVEMMENEVVEWLRDQWSKDSSGDVAVELVASNRMRGDGEGRGVEELLSLRTGELVLG